MSQVGLAEVIRALRAELEEAVAEGEGKQIQFSATSVDVEFKVGVTNSADGKAGVRFWVVELGGGGSHAAESIQTIKLTLDPLGPGGGALKISSGTDADPLTRSKDE